jgi:acetyl-CoA acetyltransferase
MDATAAKIGFTREQQDAYAAESRRAVRASNEGDFKAEIAVTVKTRGVNRSSTRTKHRSRSTSIRSRPRNPAFGGWYRHGSVVVVDLGQRRRVDRGQRVRGEGVGLSDRADLAYSSHAWPREFTTPAPAIRKALDRGWAQGRLAGNQRSVRLRDDGREQGTGLDPARVASAVRARSVIRSARQVRA